MTSASDGRSRRRGGKGAQRDKGYFMISVVARRFEVHPQTLRLYEREGLVTPSRTRGNTRLYSEEDLERLSFILNLTRDLGVNLAGVEIIMNLRGRLESMQREMEHFIDHVKGELEKRKQEGDPGKSRALVRVAGPGRVLKSETR